MPAKRSVAVFPHDLSILFFPFPLALNCMCFKYVFARVHWPLHTKGELLNSPPLRLSQFSLALALNRGLLGLLELNHNYLPSSDGGESVHCVIPISPPDIKNAPRTQRGEHYVGLMDSTGEAEFETGLQSSLSCSRCSFSLFIPSSPPFCTHLSSIFPTASLSILFLFIHLLKDFFFFFCGASASKKKKCLFRVKVSFI